MSYIKISHIGISFLGTKKRGTVFTVKEAVEARQTNKRTAHAEA